MYEYTFCKGGVIINSILTAFLLTAVAGLATCLGGCAVFFTKNAKNADKALGVCLAFSAGIMIYISFTEIFTKAQNALGNDTFWAFFLTNIGFFAGIGIMVLLQWLLPEKQSTSSHVMMAGIYTVLATTIHNFPEGLATFMAVLQGQEAALPTFFALALHNIPEGFAVCMPIAYATHSRLRGFGASVISGVAEPIGALLGWFILRPFMNDTVSGMIFAATSGIMVYLCFAELIPLAEKNCGHKQTLFWLISGFLVIGASLVLLKV